MPLSLLVREQTASTAALNGIAPAPTAGPSLWNSTSASYPKRRSGTAGVVFVEAGNGGNNTLRYDTTAKDHQVTIENIELPQSGGQTIILYLGFSDAALTGNGYSVAFTDGFAVIKKITAGVGADIDYGPSYTGIRTARGKLRASIVRDATTATIDLTYTNSSNVTSNRTFIHAAGQSPFLTGNHCGIFVTNLANAVADAVQIDADVPLPSPPNVPTAPTESGIGNTTATFNWAVPSGGGAVNNYLPRYRTVAGPGAWVLPPSAINSSTFSWTPTGLAPATAFEWQVAATNTGGTSAYTALRPFSTDNPATGGGALTGGSTPNLAPTYTGATTFNIAELQTVGGALTATDPETNPLTWSILAGLDAARVSLVGTSGTAINWQLVSALDFENPQQVGGTANRYQFNVRVTDGVNNTDTLITFNVTNVNESPSITSSATRTIAENQTLVGALTASDPDAGTTYTWSILTGGANGADAAMFALSATTGSTVNLLFAAPQNYETPSDANGDGTYQVTVGLSDGAIQTSQLVSVTVTNVLETLAISGLTTGVAGSTATVTVRDEANALVSGATLAWTGSPAGSSGGTTNGSGQASVTLPSAAGSYTLIATKGGINANQLVSVSPIAIVDSLLISPVLLTRLMTGSTVTFSATVLGVAAVGAYSVLSGSGAISSGGVYTAGQNSGAVKIGFTETSTGRSVKANILEITKDMDDTSLETVTNIDGVLSGQISFSNGGLGRVQVTLLAGQNLPKVQIFGPGTVVPIYWNHGIKTQSVKFKIVGLPAV